MTGRNLAPAVPFLIGLALLANGSPVNGQAVDEYAFVLRMGVDTLAVENVVRGPDRLQVDLTGASIGRVRIDATLGSAATIRSLAFQAWRAGGSLSGEPSASGMLSVRQDPAIAEFESPGGSPRRFDTRPGAIPHVNPSFAIVEQIVLRARALGGDSVDIPVLLQSGQTVPASVRSAQGEAVRVRLGGVDLNATVDAAGRLLAAAVDAQNLKVERASSHLPPPSAQAPDYSAPPGAPYTAEEVSIRVDTSHTLAGTLTRPAGQRRVPAVVLVSGSGPQDRDESFPMMPGLRPFRQIADTLSRRGIAVLRMDDRGHGASTGHFASATSADFAADVQAAVAYLRRRSDIDGSKIAIVGHSEGGLIAPIAAAEDPRIAAIVLIASPSRTGRDIIAYQQRYAIEHSAAIPPEGRDSAFAHAQALLTQEAERQPWLRYFLDHDPLPVARRVRNTPVLILQGETDRQVTSDQANELAAAFRAGGNTDVTVRLLPDVNHILLRDPDGGPGGYASLTSREVVPEVLGSLADWLAKRLR